jgi:dolichol-phosphate mannosyltransferase
LDPKITIIIPTYNEAENISRLVSALFSLSINNLNILVVDDNSPDGTGRIADELVLQYSGQLEVLHRTGQRGFAPAYMDGFKIALNQGSNAIGQMDADLSHPPDKLPELIENLQNNDVTIGSRYVRGGGVDPRWPVWRKALSRFGNFYARTILNIPVKDATGGYRLWRSSALAQIPFEHIRSNGYAFQVEMLYLAHRLGFTIYEVPILFIDRQWGKSKMSFRIQREAALRVWQIKYAYHSVKPNKG